MKGPCELPLLLNYAVDVHSAVLDVVWVTGDHLVHQLLPGQPVAVPVLLRDPLQVFKDTNGGPLDDPPSHLGHHELPVLYQRLKTGRDLNVEPVEYFEEGRE